MSFRKQLLLGIGALIAVMMFCATMAVAALRTSTTAASNVTSELLAQLDTTQRLGILSERLVASARGYMLDGNARERRIFDEVAHELMHLLAGMTRSTRSLDRLAQLSAVGSAAERYVQETLQATTPSGVDDATFAQRVRPAQIALTDAVQELIDLETSTARALTERAGQRVRIAGLVLVIGCGIGVLIGVGLAVMTSRRLVGQYTRGQQEARAASEAAQARKELLDMASHDLRSPLHSIMLSVDLIRDEQGAIPRLTALEQAADRMQKLVEGLLDASEAETTGLALHCERTHIAELFGATLTLFGPRAERAGIRLHVDAPPPQPIDVDRERVLQILANLVSNALSFTPRGGQVSLSAIRVGDVTRICVKDTGPGIPEEERAGLFRSFYQAGQGRDQKRSRRGSVGLGLYIAKNLVVAHGGRIGVDSAVGRGSTFWFEVPCDASRAAGGATGSVAVRDVARR